MGLGYAPQLLDHQSDRVRRAEQRCLLQPALPQRSRLPDLVSYKVKGRRFAEAWCRLPLSNPFPIDQPDELPGYEIIIVGSDEVWNFQHPWYGSSPIFFGGGLETRRLISYAASFGNHDASKGIPPPWAEKLRRFHSISVRDDNSRRLVESALGTQAELVLDPCLLFPAIIEDSCDPPHEPFALIYGHGFPPWLQHALQSWSRATGIRLLSVGYWNQWAHESHIDAGPLQFAQLMSQANAVVTNFFHGCVFALINRKPFLSTPSAHRFNKVRDLAAALEAEHRIVTEETPQSSYRELLGAAPEEHVIGRIDLLRDRSISYLRGALA